ncbi:orotate phosphoribosyltransferase [Lactiplantibacillus paraplantarum]|uniref:orotate phosphoribosyltransferase n=1 Tax=Lactiplantibacillus paraplantarum TaxID=60520 RepID=UPI000513ED6D|nr:orotate phosphoribosyltransferase [Lactiplantibacillus paraplantarum]OAX74210.1 Orotate phosphoribosyltransferase [Lactiplantibacillus plantarum]ALO04906.1 Orotate phosphoribosyltransferase [Lactiplantibacillus paraplantarum]KGE74318.1 Orotate phosphoribosyltransferase [Lactiplantibacillus paraplantarum]MCW1911017.1 orotate phosphoribosyltransferase [Lactiplantibacillus paraplantarum]RDG12219.1 orotate phosphoribosyltransferase [Lactiplantibacillus paraplantarum]
MSEIAATIATDLLAIKAVTLRPNAPFTWASGIKSPIYTDNRLTISYPAVRQHIAQGIAAIIKREYPATEVIAGVATAGIPHAAWVAELLNLPLIYVRAKPKDHGAGRQIEGVLKPGQKVVMLDDLISTGGSVLQAAKAVQAAGGDIQAVGAIFSYALDAATQNFAAASLPLFSLSNYPELIKVARQADYIDDGELASLHTWRQDPEHWGVTD